MFRRSLPRLSILATIVGVTIACPGDGTDSQQSESVPAVAPFDGLTSVRLPTTLRRLQIARPQARATDFGLRESIGGIEFQYVANRKPGSEDYPGPEARVDHVLARWEGLSEDSATTLWRKSLARLTAALGVPPQCSSAVPHVVFARWQKPSGAIAYMRRQHSVAGPVRQSAAFSIGFSVDTTTLAPALTGAVAKSCEDPFQS